MKVLRRKAVLLILGYVLLVILTMLHFADHKGTKECNQVKYVPYPLRYTMDHQRPSLPLNTTTKRQHVFVFTTWRSGSSFVGELFNQNPDVFFLYEPMWHVWQKLYPGDALTLQGAARDMLGYLYRCDLSIFQLYNGGANVTSMGIFGAPRNKVVCSYPLCTAFRKDIVGLIDEHVCKKECPPQNIELLEEECHRYNTIVIKGVRIFDLNVLAPLIKDPSIGLKVIHLVRDPRAVANSRIKSRNGLIRESLQVMRSKDPKGRRLKAYDGYQRSRRDAVDYHALNALEVICSSIVRTVQMVREPPDWLKDSYRVVRYEDLVEDPIRYLKEMYHFVNLTVSEDIERFVLNMTMGSTYSSKKPFSVTSRNATQAANAWRTQLTFPQIKQVEEYCQQAMDWLGYEKVQNPEEVKDFSKTFVTKLRF
ncbi:carbohydrate sulfotransferase 2 [Callorhinchus milii]|uniref:Sulfotransferase n=1 Tax=Callorhinchus milii TaxID=7868 RepID=V9KTU7_CALMI|nr:carbohydrate sulfotransferase 2 [Callorhinchus milii]|eukprot:gi/632933852/ref/XP_007890557.1/ PREDICTED: carbohydrate sulfotransferase 2 [Callorhinchus milii]